MIALNKMKDAALILDLPHDSPEYRQILETENFKIVHYWGGGNGLSAVQELISRNPYRPRLLINGPLTGVAVVDSTFLAKRNAIAVASELAFNVAIFEQKLCSSPTECYFLGSITDCTKFARLVSNKLVELDNRFPHATEADLAYKIQLFRNILKREGALVLTPESESPAWTIVVSEGASLVENVTSKHFCLSIHERTKFLEIIVVRDLLHVVKQVQLLPFSNCHRGIDRVGTIGYALRFEDAQRLASMLARIGVYRVVPLEGIFGRSSYEPADGRYIPREFTYFSYLASPSHQSVPFWSKVRGRWRSKECFLSE